jgi:hypothetical protein
MVDQRAVERVFRAANERLRFRMERLSVRGRRPVICECSDPDCIEVLELTRKEYQHVRDEGNFVITPGHGIDEIEHVVERGNAYEIVRKH